jgi:predicted alpha/beta hydrolase
VKSINFRTKDGCAISGTLYEPTAVVGASEVQPAGAVLMVCAMGVPQTFYRSFCEWLAQHGLVVMTFDYRGMGQSRTTALRRVEATVLTWAEQDAASAL